MHQNQLKILSLFCFIYLSDFYLFSIQHNVKTLQTFIYSRHWLFSKKKNQLLFFYSRTSPVESTFVLVWFVVSFLVPEIDPLGGLLSNQGATLTMSVCDESSISHT